MKIFKLRTRTKDIVFKLYASGFTVINVAYATFKHYVRSTYNATVVKFAKLYSEMSIKSSYKPQINKYIKLNSSGVMRSSYRLSVNKFIYIQSRINLKSNYKPSIIIKSEPIDAFIASVATYARGFIGRLRRFTDNPGITLDEMKDWTIREFDYIEY